ncbi:MAG: hypothetical protein PUC12_11205 [Clostridiales bacterium]|nr:hypothetical protein [Clostridiales bacterium]
MIIHKYRDIIAKTTLIHIFLLFFLSIHFTAWGGIYTEDGLSPECIVYQGMQIIEKGTDQQLLSAMHFNHQMIELWMVSFDIIGLCGLVFFVFYFRKSQKLFYLLNTLVRLSVRLDN